MRGILHFFFVEKNRIISYNYNATKNSCCIEGFFEKEELMGKKQKMIKRLKSKPKDFTFEEAETLLEYLGYQRFDKGKTSGSRVIFKNQKHGSILLHKPHSRKELLDYQIKQLVETLEKEGLV